MVIDIDKEIMKNVDGIVLTQGMCYGPFSSLNNAFTAIRNIFNKSGVKVPAGWTFGVTNGNSFKEYVLVRESETSDAALTNNLYERALIKVVNKDMTIMSGSNELLTIKLTE